MLDADGGISRHVHVFIDGRSAIWLAEGKATRIEATHQVEFFPAVAGAIAAGEIRQRLLARQPRLLLPVTAALWPSKLIVVRPRSICAYLGRPVPARQALRSAGRANGAIEWETGKVR